MRHAAEQTESGQQLASRRAGFDGIEDMLARDFGAFEALAERWRKGNPASALLSAGGGRVDPYTRAVQAWKADFMRVVSGKTPVDSAINMPMPTVLVAMGVRKPVLSLPVRYLQGIAAKHTDLPASAMLALPEMLSSPLAVIPHKDGGYRMVLEAKSANGDPIVAGISLDGRIQTVFPRPPAELAQEVERALGAAGVNVYARNKEALTEIRASRGVPIGSQGPSRSASTGAAPATIALHRSPRDRAIVLLRERVVKEHGEFGPGVRLSTASTNVSAPAPDATARAEALIRTSASTPKPLDALARTLTRVTGVERAAALLYGLGARLIDRITPEALKARFVSDYGAPEAVIDQRSAMQGSQRRQLREAGVLLMT